MSFKNEEFVIMKYLAFGGAGSGASASDPLPLEDNAELAVLEAGMVVKEVDFVVTTAFGTASDPLVGDEDDDDEFVDADDVTEATPASYAGSGDLTSSGKYYSADKNLAYAQTGTATAGACVIVVRGYKV